MNCPISKVFCWFYVAENGDRKNICSLTGEIVRPKECIILHPESYKKRRGK